MVAHHELGHALVAMALPGTDPVHKISIIPRGVAALGYTMQRPTEDRFLMTREELENKMAVLLGGRAAEEVVFGHLSTGAADDLAKVTDIARSMVMRYGMVKSLGHVAYEEERAAFPRRPAAERSSRVQRGDRARDRRRRARDRRRHLREGDLDPAPRARAARAVGAEAARQGNAGRARSRGAQARGGARRAAASVTAALAYASQIGALLRRRLLLVPVEAIAKDE